MATYKIILATGEFYHIFNKTVASEDIFKSRYNLNRALELVDFYRFKPSLSFSNFKSLPQEERKKTLEQIYSLVSLVEIFTFAFMPNHYHFLLRQLEDGGINFFISNFQNALAKFYNLKFKRKGSLFCHSFERVRVESDEQFIHLSRYIHLNPVTAYLIKMEELENQLGTSFMDYMGKRSLPFVSKEVLMSHFKNPEKYRQFVEDQEDYQKELQRIKNLISE